MKLGTISKEAALCRKAFKASKVGNPVVHYHHDSIVGKLEEPAEERIAVILTQKPEEEQAYRLHFFRPLNVLALPEAAKRAYANWLKADADW